MGQRDVAHITQILGSLRRGVESTRGQIAKAREEHGGVLMLGVGFEHITERITQGTLLSAREVRQRFAEAALSVAFFCAIGSSVG